MDSAHASAQPGSRDLSSRWRRAVWIAVALGVAAYGGWLAWHMNAWAAGADSSGYINNARLLRAGNLRAEQRQLDDPAIGKLPDYAYVPLGFVPAASATMVPTYPVGYSLLIAATSFFTGWSAAPHVTMWLHALAGVALMFALARAFGLSRGAAVAGAALLAFSPLYLFSSIQAMSDMPALVWCTAGVLCAIRGRTSLWWALAAGGAASVAVLIRPTDILILAPIALLYGRNVRSWLCLVLGAAPGAIFQGLLNHALYGSAFRNGYGSVGYLFAWANVSPSLGNYLGTLPLVLTPGVLLLLGLPWLWRNESAWRIAALAVWIGGFFGFYLFYFYTHEFWWYLRFVLPAFPAVIVSLLLVANAIARAWPVARRRAGWAAAVLAIVGWDAVWIQRFHVANYGRGEHVYHEVMTWSHDHLPPNAIVACMQVSGAFFYYSDFVVVRWDMIQSAHVAQLERSGRPIYAVLFPFETKDALDRNMPGHWTQIGAVSQVTIWRREK